MKNKINLDDKNILVTGGNGMIGRQLVELLYDTTSANIMVADLPNVDLRDRKDCKDVCEGQDIVFHLAGIKGSPIRCMESPASFSVPMIQFNANMVEAAYNANVEWFLYTSSVGVYHPAEVFVEDDVWKTFPSENDWYAGWAKRIGEMNVEAYMKQYDWNKCSIVRPANVYGPYDNFNPKTCHVIPALIHRVLSGEDPFVVWGTPDVVRDFLYVRDVVDGGLLVLEKGESMKPYNIGAGTAITVGDIVESILKATDKNPKIVYDETKPTTIPFRMVSTDRIQNELGFKSKWTFEEGIQKTVNWYLENYR